MPARPLTPAQRTYAEGRARLLSQAAAGRAAGITRRATTVAWERLPQVQAEVQRLKRAATAVAHAVAAQRQAQRASSEDDTATESSGSVPRGVTEGNEVVHVSGRSLAAVADLGEALATQSEVLRETRGRRVSRSWTEGSGDEQVMVQEVADGQAAATLLIRHYDARETPPQASVSVQAIVLQMVQERGAEGARQVFARLVGQSGPEVE